MIDHDSIIREDVPAARFDFDREAFIVPTATTDDELLTVIGQVTDTVVDAYAAITRHMPGEFKKLAEAYYRAKRNAI